MKPVISIFEQIHQDGISILEGFGDVRVEVGRTREAQLEIVEKSDGIIVKSVTRVDHEMLAKSNTLKIVGRAGTGTDNIDLESAQKEGIRIATVPGGNTVTAAEFTVMQILYLCRRMNEVIRAAGRRDYRRHLIEGRELSTMVVGIIGLGNVGIAVAERLAPFGCRLVAWDRSYKNKDSFFRLGGSFANSLGELLSSADVITLHTTLNSTTHHLLNSETLSLVRPGTLLVNTARAGLIEDEALLRAVEGGVIAGASLDVLDPEPPFDCEQSGEMYRHKLLDQPRIFITPHIGASTVDAQRRISIELARAIEEFFKC